MPNARLGTFDDLLHERADSLEVADIARQLRAVILAPGSWPGAGSLADAVEVVRLGDGAASYGVGEKKMSESHVYVAPKRDYVNLGFWHGVDLPDPEALLEGTGKKMRHIKVRSVEEAQTSAVRDLIAAALAERRDALGL